MASPEGLRLRRRISLTLTILTFLLAVIAGPIWYASEILRNEDRFVAVTDGILSHPDIRWAVATEVTTFALEALETDEAVAELLPGETRALAVPLTRVASGAITEAAFGVLDSDVAVTARHAALREVHAQLTADEEEVRIDLRPVAVRTTRELAGPTAGSAVATFLVKTDEGTYVIAERDTPAADALAAVRSIESIGLVAGSLTLVALLSAIIVDSDRPRTLVRVGIALTLGTAVSVVLVAVALQSTGLLIDSPLGPDVGRGLAESVSADFGQRQRGGFIGGAFLALVGLLLGRRRSAVALRSLPGRLWRHDGQGVMQALSSIVLDNPALARIVGWLVPALTLLTWTLPTARVVVVTLVLTAMGQLGIWYLASRHRRASEWRARFGLPDPGSETADIAGSTAFLRVNVAAAILLLFLFWPGWSLSLVRTFFLILAGLQVVIDVRATRRLVDLNAVPGPVTQATADVSTRRWIVATVTVLVILVGAIGLTLTGGDMAEAETACNGSTELCSRSVDEIVWAGSHNSMSSNDLGWQLAAQTGDMVAQLDHGVRALLIDTHYWTGEGQLDGEIDEETEAIIAAAVEDDIPRSGTWLCHGLCALGATDLITGLTDVRLWLEENRREVVMFVIQDEISTDDTIAAFEASGLIGHVHRHEPGTPFPTLGALVESDERVLVYAENEGSPDSWYQNAWETAFTDTPFSFSVRSDFECSTSRGDAGNPLLLVNHWLTTGVPLVDTASVVNSRSTLLDRVEQCQDEIGRLPTVLAVDFAETGDLVDVVAELNGAGS